MKSSIRLLVGMLALLSFLAFQGAPAAEDAKAKAQGLQKTTENDHYNWFTINNIFNWYGNTEMCGNIVECSQGELHLKEEHSMVEVLDEQDRPCGPGESGRLVCTGFGNDAFPLIRYEVGDRVTLAKEQAARCGRGGTIVETIEGRVEDYIFTPDGRMVGRRFTSFSGSGFAGLLGELSNQAVTSRRVPFGTALSLEKSRGSH